jgi:hypothetical protein
VNNLSPQDKKKPGLKSVKKKFNKTTTDKDVYFIRLPVVVINLDYISEIMNFQKYFQYKKENKFSFT